MCRLIRWCFVFGALNIGATWADDGWQLIEVPGAWEEKAPATAAKYDGFAWFRTWVKPHDEFFTPHERNLFEESVSLTLPNVADASEVFVNGVRIGGAGSFPPNFVSGRSETLRYKVPPGALRKGEWNEIAVRVYNQTGSGGFLGEAPFLMDYFQECVLGGTWEFRLGDGSNWTGPALKNRPTTSAFDTYRESNRLLGESPRPVTGPKLPPDETLKLMQPLPDLAVDLLLHEPLVAQPVHLSFDDHGRLWVSQYRQYPYPAGVHPVSRDKYYRTHYDAVPPPPPHHAKGRDVISVHEDTDGDGKFDRHRVFQDGLNLANAALVGHGGVWVMHTPHLLFYPDENGDAVPDGPPEVKLSGFGLEDSHSVANGLTWGMDGWLYGCQGSTCSCRVTRPGIDSPGAPAAAFEGCMVWRYHPDTKAFEIFAEGSGNTFGLEIDSAGRLFSGHNGGDTRGWHYVQGGFYLKQGVDPGKFGPARYAWTFGDLPMMPSRTPAVRFTHLFAVGEGSALPAAYQQKLFALDPLHNVVIAAERRKLGSSFETSDIGPALKCGDSAFRPVYVTNAPDGSLFIADLYEHYIAHGQHYQSQIDAETGRIWRLRGKDAVMEKDINLVAKSGEELVALLRHPNKWRRHTAVRLLGERREANTRPLLWKMAEAEVGVSASGAVWALHQAGWIESDDDFAKLLAHSSPIVRTWAVRFVGERYGVNPGIGLPPSPMAVSGGRLSNRLRQELAHMGVVETDAEVRSQLACAARRLPDGLAVLASLTMHDEDVSDPFLPQLCWYAVEHHWAGHEVEILEFLKDGSVWKRGMVAGTLLPRLMRRLVAEGSQSALQMAARLLQLAPDDAAAKPLLAGFNEAVQGRDLSGMPESLVAALAARGGMTLPLRLRKGESAALAEAVSLLKNSAASLEDRLLCLRTLGEMRQVAAVPVFLDVASDNKAAAHLRRAALSVLSGFEDPQIPTKLLALLPQAPAEIQTAALASLASRPAWCEQLLTALRSGKFAVSAVPMEIVEALRQHPDKAVASAAAKLFPPAGNGNWRQTLAKVEAALKSPGGNPYAGEVIFSQRCASCHKLFFKGGSIGPDLTTYQRDNLGTMLVSIVNPNAEIREGFLCQIVETKSGLTVSGYLQERTAEVVRIRTLDGQITNVAATEIKAIAPLGRSLMPEGLLDGLTDSQLRDLFAWLRQSQPISK